MSTHCSASTVSLQYWLIQQCHTVIVNTVLPQQSYADQALDLHMSWHSSCVTAAVIQRSSTGVAHVAPLKLTCTRCSKSLVTNRARASAGSGKTCSMMIASSLTAWVMDLYRAARDLSAVMAVVGSVTCPTACPRANSRASMNNGRVLM